MIYLAAFLAGAGAEWLAEVWGVRYSNAVNGRYARLAEDEMAAKVWRARKSGLILLILSQVDNSAIFGGFWVYGCVVLGAVVGAWTGVGHVMRAKWRRLNGPKPEPANEDEEEGE